MRKTLLLIFALASFTIASAQNNLILNGDIEQWDSLTGALEEWGRFFSGQVEKSNDAQSGKASIKLITLDFGNNINFIYSNSIEFEAGKTYSGSFYYKVLSGVFDGMEVYIRGFLERDFIYPVTNLAVGGWQKCEFTYVPSRSAPFEMEINVRGANGSAILIDNAVLVLGSLNSVESAQDDKAVSVYPNPTTDYLYVSDFQNVTSTKINAVNGSLCKQVDLGADGRISVKDLPQGLYLLNMVKNGEAVSSKFIKN